MKKPVIDVKTLESLHFKFWTQKHIDELKALDELADKCHKIEDIDMLLIMLLDLAIRVLKHACESHAHGILKFILICGPISTGGTGVLKENIKIFRMMITYFIVVLKLPVFSQIPFETVLRKVNQIYREWWNSLSSAQKKEHPRYCIKIMELFYQGLFNTGCFGKFCFIPDWEDSQGTNWERWYVLTHGIPFSDIDRNTLNMIKRWLRIPINKKVKSKVIIHAK